MSTEDPTRNIDSLWMPGQSLNHEYPAATPEQLSEAFTRHLGSRMTVLNEVLGVVRETTDSDEVQAIASIDLCEVVRSTAYSISTTHGKEYHGNNYRLALWEDELFAHSEEEHAFLSNTIQSIAQVMMNSGHVQPVEGIDEIADMTARWRKKLGVYCVANTSTLSGCELATVSFINTHLPESFDGIVFPRNPLGRRDQITKSRALKMVIDVLAERGHECRLAVHVDDSEGHHLSMIEDPPHAQTHVFLLEHPEFMPVDLGPATNVTRSPSPLDSFRAMDDYLVKSL